MLLVTFDLICNSEIRIIWRRSVADYVTFYDV